MTPQLPPLVEGCTFPEPNPGLMATPGKLPLLVKQGGSGKPVRPAEVSFAVLLNGYGDMTNAAGARHKQLMALQAHIRDVAKSKRRCGSPPVRVASVPPSTP